MGYVFEKSFMFTYLLVEESREVCKKIFNNKAYILLL